MEARLVLEDGTVWTGISFGAKGTVVGEVVFATHMSGYQRVLSDPSFAGQMVCMTSPMLGNCGMGPDANESERMHARALIVRDVWERPSHWRTESSLEQYLLDHGVVGMSGVDTRALTRHLRQVGTLRGALSTDSLTFDELLDRARTRKSGDPMRAPSGGYREERSGNGHHVVLIDFGCRQSIIQKLQELDCRITRVAAETSATEVLALKPDGVLLSNGPGDPRQLTDAVRSVRQLLGRVPIFGIGLGHQLLALVAGGRVARMKSGHRGANHPVKNVETGKVRITSQNHGYVVEAEALPEALRITHINCNDGTIEGLRHNEHPAFSVQFQPETHPGAEELGDTFASFIALMTANQTTTTTSSSSSSSSSSFSSPADGSMPGREYA